MANLLWLPINFFQAVYAVVWTVFSISLALIARYVTGGTKVPLGMARWLWGRGMILGSFSPVRISGLENVDFSKPHFFSANHESILDIPLMFYALPAEVHFIVKQEMLSVPFINWYVRAMGMIVINRDQRLSSLAQMRRAPKMLAQGKNVVLFPEGRRSRTGRIEAFKPGVFVPAIEGQVPVVPVALYGVRKVLPPKGFHPRPGRIWVAIGKPIPTTGLTPEDRRDLARQVQREVIKLWEGLREADAALLRSAAAPAEKHPPVRGAGDK